jgi:hypothetical protein
MKLDLTFVQWVFNNILLTESGCWQWVGEPTTTKMHVYVAELCHATLPRGQKYRMPDCVLGDECLNPSHVGTKAEWNSVVRHELGSREPSKRDLAEEDIKAFFTKQEIEWYSTMGSATYQGTNRQRRHLAEKQLQNWELSNSQDRKFLKGLRIVWDGDKRDECK